MAVVRPLITFLVFDIDNRLTALKSIIKKYKIGILYVKQGQQNENDMFSNNSNSNDYDQFLSLLGEKIQLKGWQK